MKDDAEHYFRVLTRLDAALLPLRDVLHAHEACPGCPLCLDCAGIEYTLDIYFDSMLSDAPAAAVTRFRAERPHGEQPEVETTPAASRPYWLP